MNTWIKVARYHLLKRFDYVVLPWAWTAFAFVVDLVIFAMVPVSHSYHQVLTAHGIAQVAAQAAALEGDAPGPLLLVTTAFLAGLAWFVFSWLFNDDTAPVGKDARRTDLGAAPGGRGCRGRLSPSPRRSPL